MLVDVSGLSDDQLVNLVASWHLGYIPLLSSSADIAPRQHYYTIVAA